MRYLRYGGYLRSQILSCDKAAMEMPGKGEVVAYAYHLKARVILIITQVYEDLLGLAESARQRTRLPRLCIRNAMAQCYTIVRLASRDKRWVTGGAWGMGDC